MILDISGYRCARNIQHQGVLAVVADGKYRRSYCVECAPNAILRDGETFGTVIGIAEAWLHDGDIGATSQDYKPLVPQYMDPRDPGFEEAIGEMLKTWGISVSEEN